MDDTVKNLDMRIAKNAQEFERSLRELEAAMTQAGVRLKQIGGKLTVGLKSPIVISDDLMKAARAFERSTRALPKQSRRKAR